MAEEEQQPTAEAIEQRRKREKDTARNTTFGIEKFTFEVAGAFKCDLKFMQAHGINNQQDVHQQIHNADRQGPDSFRKASLGAYRNYHGTFHNLELPCWVITDGTQKIEVLELRKIDTGEVSL